MLATQTTTDGRTHAVEACLGCREHHSQYGRCEGARGDLLPSGTDLTCFEPVPRLDGPLDAFGEAMGLEEFMHRVTRILYSPLEEGLAHIDAETEIQVLTQARDVCPDDRLEHLKRKIIDLFHRTQPATAGCGAG